MTETGTVDTAEATDPSQSPGRTVPLLSSAQVRLWLVGLVTLAIGAVFVSMIADFLIALFLAGIFSAMASPLYRRVYRAIGERKGLAVGLTLLILISCVLLPMIAVVLIGAQQAATLTEDISKWVSTVDIDKITARLPDWLPFHVDLAELSASVVSKIGQIAGKAADLFVSFASAATRGTAAFFLNLFVMVYAMVFFLPLPTNAFAQLLSRSGLPADVQTKISERVISISRATIKGTFVIGVVQGVLGGIGFWAAGLSGAAFWGCVMAVLSAIPGIGPSLVLIPGIIVLAVEGQTLQAVGLALWTVLAVTSVDNFLRPLLVGRDTKMSDLLVLISTFGGLAMFGAVGLITGPVIAGLFVTIWSVLEEKLADAGVKPEEQALRPGSDAKQEPPLPEEIRALKSELAALKAEAKEQRREAD
jgi:predicted PurR-regulated permease PerM